MAKSANICVRIEPELKEQAEIILAELGIPVSDAITMFYKQIILQRGMPFKVKLPAVRSLDVSILTDEQFDAELEKGFVDITADRTRPAAQVFDDIRWDYGV